MGSQLPRSLKCAQGAQFYCQLGHSVELCSHGTNLSTEQPVRWTYQLIVFKKSEKTQLPVVRSHYRLFMNEYSRMLRHQKLRQSMENTLQLTFTTLAAFLSEILPNNQFKCDSAHVVGHCRFQLVVPTWCCSWTIDRWTDGQTDPIKDRRRRENIQYRYQVQYL